jgi:predicted permease
MQAIQCVLTILLMMGVGVVAAWKLGFDERSSAGIAALVVNIAFPASMLSSIASNYTRESLLSMAPGLAIPFATLGLLYVLGMLVAKLMGVAEGRRGAFFSMFALSNAIFVGMPVNLMLFGDECVPYVLLFYIGNTVIFWTIGVFNISRDGSNRSGKILTRENFKRIFSVPLSAFFVSVFIVVAGIRLPALVLDLCKTIGGMTTPLAMIFIGVALYSVDWKSIRPDRNMAALLAGRFVVAPLVTILLCRGMPMPLLMKKVFLIQASMPIMTQTAIIAKAYKGDHKFAAVQTSVSTLASLATIPIYMALMDHFDLFA